MKPISKTDWAGLSLVFGRRECSSAIHIGHAYGYTVYLVKSNHGPRVAAGCRWFTFTQAEEHWSDVAATEPITSLRYMRANAILSMLPRMRQLAKELKL